MRDDTRELRDKQLNFRLSVSEMLELGAIARELDFPPTTLARRIVKQYLKKYREDRKTIPTTVTE